MNAYDAFMKAAAHIEANPHLYDFFAVRSPPPGGNCPACMWGWVGYFAGMHGALITYVAKAAGFPDTDVLYGFCTRRNYNFCDPACVAKALRAFASAQWPPSPSAIPESVRRIFENPVVHAREPQP